MPSTDRYTLSPASAGARLDRLPISRFHRRVLWLIGGGMFLDSFDIYLAGGVLGALAKTGWSTMHLNAAFLSSTFIGMLIGAFTAGVLGDAKGRKFTYQFNLAVFGLASLAGAFAPNMTWLIVCRFFMGLGLGAEIVVGYGSVGEFMPPAVRGKWSAYLSLITNSALFFSTFLGYLIIPSIGWRAMFAIVGVGAMIVWVLRKKMPESPRWLESKGRYDEAEAILREAEAESTRNGTLPPVVDAPRTVTRKTTLLEPLRAAADSPHGALRHRADCRQHGDLRLHRVGADVPDETGARHGIVARLYRADGARRTGRRAAGRTDRRQDRAQERADRGVGAHGGHRLAIRAFTGIEMATLLGFVLFTLTYLMVALGIATYIPELFATENRMRANGIAGCAGRITGIVAPQLVVMMYAAGGVKDVLSMIIGALVVLVGRPVQLRHRDESTLARGHCAFLDTNDPLPASSLSQ